VRSFCCTQLFSSLLTHCSCRVSSGRRAGLRTRTVYGTARYARQGGRVSGKCCRQRRQTSRQLTLACNCAQRRPLITCLVSCTSDFTVLFPFALSLHSSTVLRWSVRIWYFDANIYISHVSISHTIHVTSCLSARRVR